MISIDEVKQLLNRTGVDYHEIAKNYVQLGKTKTHKTTIHKKKAYYELYVTKNDFHAVLSDENLKEYTDDYIGDEQDIRNRIKPGNQSAPVICISNGNKLLHPSSENYISDLICVYEDDPLKHIIRLLADNLGADSLDNNFQISYLHSIDFDRLDKSMKWFVNYVITQQNNSDISFDSGWLKQTEGYKYEVYQNAHNTLQFNNWSKDLIGTGKILKNVLDAFSKKSDKNFNNIVQFQGLTHFKKCAESNLSISEEILYRLYLLEDPSDAFDDACDFWGKRYPELSYLMFMRDRDRFLPVKTERHKKCFDALGIETNCLKYCSWDNYLSFLKIHEVIRKRLEQYLGMPVSLLDAHSFVWVIQRANDDLSNFDTTLPDTVTDDNDPLSSTVIVGSKEGKVTYHYVTKYERSSKNRAAAIHIHGYRCMACGFEFEKVYGELGRDYIEVHHTKPLHSLTEEIQIDPREDLICLCANCHRMIHKKRGSVLSLDELKQMIKISFFDE